MAAEQLRFGVLGPLLVERGGQPVEPPRSGVLRGLLGVLLLARGEPVAVGRLAELVWQDRADRIGRGAVQVAVSRLRLWLWGQLGEPPGRPDRIRVEFASGGYRLMVDHRAVDLGCLHERLGRAGQVEDAAERCELLASALGLVRGPVLGDLSGLDATDPLLQSVEDAVRDAGLALGEAALAAGRPRVAAAPLGALAAARPLDEPVHARLIEVLAACGRPSQALDHYEELRVRLAQELGVSPSRQVQQAYLAVLAGDRVLPVSTHDATSGRAPALMLLPADIADFTGRARQLQALGDLLAGSDRDGQQATAVVVLVVTGTAGVGKTALAVHWAHRIADRFPDGQLHIDLRGYARPSPLRPIEALATLLRLLGTPPDQIPVDVAEAAARYRSLLAGRRVLVVVDNAASVDQVRPLLPGSPGCLVVVTSRDRLGGLVARDGARRLTLDVLTAEEAHALLVRILGQDRVQAEPQATAELARVCAYLPLALRIAAANLTDHPHRTVAAHVAELSDGNRLAALQVPGDEDSAVRATFDLSYQAIPAEARRVFRLLGLVPGPDVTPAAAAALTDTTPAEAQRLLERLAGAHLIGQHAVGRYAFHDLLRLYAREQCSADDGDAECDAAVGRLLGCYLHAADAAAGLLYPQMLRLPVPVADVEFPPVGFDDLTGALAWLEAERANLVAAIQRATDRGPRPLAWLLADCLRGYFWLRRHTVDWLTAANAALAAAGRERDPQAQAAAQLSCGDLHQVVGRYPQAVEHYTAALGLARQAGWADGQATTLGKLGNVHWLLGQLQQAAEHHAQALALHRQTGRLGGQAASLGNLGAVNQELGRLQQAADDHAQALALYRQLGSRGGEATALGNVGMVDHDLGRLDDAMEQLTRALSLHREVGDRYGEADTLDALAAVHLDAGRHSQALELARAAVALAREIGDRRIEAQALNTVGGVHLRLGCPQQAIDHHQQALDLARQTGARTPQTSALLGLAAARRHMGQHARALTDAGQALTFAGQAGHRVLEGHAHFALAAVHLDLDRYQKAAGHAQQALALYRQTGHRLGQARALVELGHALEHTDGIDAAQPCWQEALTLFTEIGSPEATRSMPSDAASAKQRPEIQNQGVLKGALHHQAW